MTEEKVLAAIEMFCISNKSRQREDLYKFLNTSLGLSLNVYDYDGTNDHARFACDKVSQQHETDYVIKKLAS